MRAAMRSETRAFLRCALRPPTVEGARADAAPGAPLPVAAVVACVLAVYTDMLLSTDMPASEAASSNSAAVGGPPSGRERRCGWVGG
jgi:hypothetical protein